MTLLWETEAADTHYSVRSHGASIRLYSNGVFHSQWNSDRPFAGGIWDCLSLPVLYRPAHFPTSVLLLGVGGGAVIRQLESLCDYQSITAVEIDPIHLDVARDWFGVDDPRVELVEDDAVAWLQNYHGAPFDLVIDDLFGHADGEPVRARALTSDWISLLRSVVQPGGLLIVNCVDGRELKVAAPAFIDEGFRAARRWSLPGYENAIGVFSDEALVPREWSRRLDETTVSAACRRQARAVMRRPLRIG